MTNETGLRAHEHCRHRDIVLRTEPKSRGDACLCTELTELTRFPDQCSTSALGGGTSNGRSAPKVDIPVTEAAINGICIAM